jgi:hypothetical protein
VLSASAGDQISSSYQEKGHGLFTYFLLKGLKEKNGDFKAAFDHYDRGHDGGVSADELTQLLKDAGVGNAFTRGAWVSGIIERLDTNKDGRIQFSEFFTRFNEPVDFAKEEGAGNDARQSTAVGWLCLAYGGFVLLLALIPNPLIGRLSFVGCGALVAIIGGLLLFTAGKDQPER